MDLYPHKSVGGLVEPVALVGHNVVIHYLNETHFRRVTFQEGIPPFQCIDLGALAAQTPSARTNIPNLELPDNEFGQFRLYPLDPVQLRVNLPPGMGKYYLKNIQVTIDPTIVDRDPDLHLTELFVWEDNRPAVEAVNFSDYALTAVRIIAMGHRFNTVELTKDVVAEVQAGRVPAVHVWCSGLMGETT